MEVIGAVPDQLNLDHRVADQRGGISRSPRLAIAINEDTAIGLAQRGKSFGEGNRVRSGTHNVEINRIYARGRFRFTHRGAKCAGV